MDTLGIWQDPRYVKLQASICKIMSNPRRIQIAHLLDTGEMSVGELVEHTGLRKAAVSQNLALMREANLVNARRDGQKVYYSLRSQKLMSACKTMEALLHELIAIQEPRD